MTNLSLHLVESADMYPAGPALRCDGATTTFSELADNVEPGAPEQARQPFTKQDVVVGHNHA